MKPIRSALAAVKEHWRAAIVLNLVYYGPVICAMIYVTSNPTLQQTLLEAAGASFTEGPLAAVGAAYGGGHVLSAMILTFVVNLFIGSLACITLPSLAIPFSGLLVGMFRAMLWGLMLSPTDPNLRLIMIPHSLTLILEGQAYILAMLAAYVQGRAFLWPRSVGVETHGQGYVAGLKRAARIYVLVVLVLAMAAVYEALEVIFFPRLVGTM